jgi:hypothetical protein
MPKGRLCKMSTITHFATSSESFRAGRFRRICSKGLEPVPDYVALRAGLILAGSAERAKQAKLAKVRRKRAAL